MEKDSHDIDGLWDELNHEVHREMQQHRLQTSTSTNVTTRISEAMQQTAAALSQFASERASKAYAYGSSSKQVSSFSSAAPTSSTTGSFLASSVGNEGHPHHHHHPLEVGSQSLEAQQQQQPQGAWSFSQQRYAGNRYMPPANTSAPPAQEASANLGSASAPLLSQETHYGDSHDQHQTTHPQPPSSQAPQSQPSDFVLLGNFRKLPKQDGWGAAADLDTFFGSVYNYYYHRGMTHIIGKGIVELISLFFTLALSVFLFVYLDWTALLTCKDESTCFHTIQEYIREQPLSKFTLWNALVFLYCILFSCYGIVSMYTFYTNVKNASLTRTFYHDQLGISSRQLEGGAIEWDAIVQKMMQLQSSGEYRMAIHGHGEELNELILAQRIMRKENFMVAFFNRNMLDLRVPTPWPFSRTGYSKGNYLCMSVQWCIHACVLNFIFNHKYKLRPAFWMYPSALQRRFFLCGLVHLVFMPFLLFFMMLHFLLLNMYDWKSSNEYLGPREWSPIAKWTFREFNELPHVYERRLGPSYQAAEDYLKLFPQRAIMAYIGRIIVFISGSLVAILLGFATLNDAIVMHVKLSQWNLFWYVGILGVGFSIGKGMLPDETVHPKYAHNLFADLDVALTKLASHTHYFPDLWRKRAWKKETEQEVQALFVRKSQLFASEVWATLMAPFVLCVSLPKCAPEICAFVRKCVVEVPGSGDVCGYACFDFDSFEDESWEGKKLGGGGGGSRVGNSHSPHDAPRTRHGKMEKSFFGFKAAHPSWRCNPSGQNLLERLERYKQVEALALAKERQHYIDAASRQLEALRVADARRERSRDAKLATSQIVDDYVRDQPSGSGRSAEDHAASGTEEKHRGSVQGGGEFGNDSIHGANSNLSSSEQQVGSHTADHGASTTESQYTPSSTTSMSTLKFRGGNSTASASISPARGTNSVMHYADMGLSEELRALLNRSTLDPALSMTGLNVGGASQLRYSGLGHISSYGGSLLGETMAADRSVNDQYLCLERYHSHLGGGNQSTIQEDDDNINSNMASSSSYNNSNSSSGVVDGEETRTNRNDGSIV